MAADILDELRLVHRLRGDTFSSAEVLGLVGRAADEVERLHAEIVRWEKMVKELHARWVRAE